MHKLIKMITNFQKTIVPVALFVGIINAQSIMMQDSCSLEYHSNWYLKRIDKRIRPPIDSASIERLVLLLAHGPKGTSQCSCEVAYSFLITLGERAIPFLVKHLTDTIPVSCYAVFGDKQFQPGHPDLGDACFETISSLLNPWLPKANCQYLEPEMLPQWWSEHKIADLVELRVRVLNGLLIKSRNTNEGFCNVTSVKLFECLLKQAINESSTLTKKTGKGPIDKQLKQ